MSIVATHFILHHKMLNILKAEERIPKETTVNDISFRQVAKLYGLEKLREEVKKNNYDVYPYELSDDKEYYKKRGK